MSERYRRLLLLPRLKIHNANALSSPFTIGFPAMTAWLGAVHALQRQLNGIGYPRLRFKALAVACHDFSLQSYRGADDFVSSLIGTANPPNNKGERPAFIEEARCHLEVSLAVETLGFEMDTEESCKAAITQALHARLKMAGGDLLGFLPPEFLSVESGNEKELHQLTRRLMPSYVLIERRDLMRKAMEEGQDALDALLDYLTVKHCSQLGENGEILWTSQRKASGWIVPIATGFHGLSELGWAENQRDPETPHRFAESVVTLGEFILPTRLRSLDDMLWHHFVDHDNVLYLCQQKELPHG